MLLSLKGKRLMQKLETFLTYTLTGGHVSSSFFLLVFKQMFGTILKSSQRGTKKSVQHQELICQH